MGTGVLSKVAIAASKVDHKVKELLFKQQEIDTVTALGTTQDDAVALTAGRNVVLASDGTVGVALPPAKLGMKVEIINTVSNQTLKVYAAVGEVINAISTTAAFSQVGGARAVYVCDALAHWYVAAANLTGTSTAATTAELDVLASVTAGTGAVSKALVLDSNGAVTIPGTVSLNGNTFTTGAPAGITGGVGTVYKNAVVKEGGIIKSRILIDLTGLSSSTTDLDVIGQGAAAAAHIGRWLAASNGTALSGTMTCLEVPVGGIVDIDLYSATVGTAKFDDLVTDLTETAIVTAGGNWTIGLTKYFQDLPAANEYLYLTGGAAGTAAAYTAGKFLIEIHGY